MKIVNNFKIFLPIFAFILLNLLFLKIAHDLRRGMIETTRNINNPVNEGIDKSSKLKIIDEERLDVNNIDVGLMELKHKRVIKHDDEHKKKHHTKRKIRFFNIRFNNE
jgi:hypothetical protein